MKRIFFVLLLLLFSTSYLFSQSYVHQVLILNEGYFDYQTNQLIEPVTIGSWNNATQVYSVVDTLDGARFATDLIFDNDYFYVAADNKLYKYDKYSNNLLAVQNVSGIRNIAIYQDKLIVSRGEYMTAYNSYFQIYSKDDLSFITELDTVDGPKWSTQNIVVYNNNVYVSINNGFEWGNEKGLVGVVDMNNLSYIDEINLGANGINPINMMLYNNNIYTVNNKDWLGTSISSVNLNSGNVITTDISSVSAGCGASCFNNGKINYQISGDSELYEWDTQVITSSGFALGFSQNFYTLSLDQISNYLYASSTDFVSYGMIHIFDDNYNELLSFSCGVSPGKIAFDVRSSLSVNELSNEFFNDVIFDLFGREIKTPFYKLPKGVYVINGEKIFKSE